jgi:hypothetical protein
LTDAEVRVETELYTVDDEDVNGASETTPQPFYHAEETIPSHNAPALLSRIEEHCAMSPPLTPVHTTYFVLDGTTALTLDGVVTPAILTSLAQSNTIVYLPTSDGIQTSLTRVRNVIWIGVYTVDPASWNVENRTYKITTRRGRTQIAPRRTVAQVHRLKRRQFERR